jgi:precorrin isomerase
MKVREFSLVYIDVNTVNNCINNNETETDGQTHTSVTQKHPLHTEQEQQENMARFLNQFQNNGTSIS